MSSQPEGPPAGTPPGLIDENNLFGSIMRLAWPVVIQQASFGLVQMVDTALVGNLGEDSLAGVRLGGQMLWFAMSGMMAVGVGATAIVARSVGAGDEKGASKVVQTVLVLGVAWGLLMLLAMFFLGGYVLDLLGAEPAARAEGVDYLKALAFAMPTLAFVFTGNAAQQGSGDTRSPMVVGVIVNIINGFVSYALINGPGPFPQLDVVGSGLGTAIASACGALMVGGVMASGTRSLVWVPFRQAMFDRGDAARILNVGVPAGLEWGQFNVAFAVYTRIVASLGTTAVAAHGVTLAIQSLTFGVGFALSIAAAAIVGQSLGAKRPDLAEKASYATMRYSMVFMGLMGVLLITQGEQITDIFVGGENAEAVIDIGGDLMFIFAFAMPGLAISLSLSGSLRGAGDTRAVLYITAGCTWLVRLFPAYLLAIPLGLDAPGAWMAAVLDISTRATLLLVRFGRGKWKEIEV